MEAYRGTRMDDTTGQWKGYVIVELEKHLDFIIERTCSSQDEAETWATKVRDIFRDDIEAYTLGVKQPLYKRLWNALRGR